MSKEKNNKKDTKNTSKKNTTPKKSTTNEVKNKKSKAKTEKEIKKEKEIKIVEPTDTEYDEDLEIEEEVRIELVEDKKKKEKSIKKEKISKIEKKAKNNKKKNNYNNFLTFLEKNHLVIYGFIAGVIIATLIAFIIWPDRIAALKNGEEPIVKVNNKNYTADYLYEIMKDNYSISLLLNEIDSDLLTKIYPENDEMNKEVESNANYYFDTYKQYYGYTKEQFLSQNGFANLNEFLDYLKLDYRRNKYLDDYIKKNLNDQEIEKYYNKNVFGDINTQHILIEFSDEEDSDKLSKEEAKKLADKIITKLNDGTSWEDIKEKYKNSITFEDLGYQSWDASLEKSFMDALTNMEDNSYSEEPVETSYGYHIIYRLDQKETPKLKKVKETIIENLISEKKADDANLLYKSLIKLRKEKNITFKDTVMKEKYEKYCDQYK